MYTYIYIYIYIPLDNRIQRAVRLDNRILVFSSTTCGVYGGVELVDFAISMPRVTFEAVDVCMYVTHSGSWISRLGITA